MTFGERMKQRRLELGKTQEEIAKAIGVTKQAIQKYEYGTVTNIPLKQAEKIAAILDTTPAYLVGWENRTPADPEWNDGQSQENIKLFSQLSADQQAEALKYLRYLAFRGETDK